MNKKIVIFFFCIVALNLLFATEFVNIYSISEPQLSQNNSYTSIISKECQTAAEAGYPNLPEFPVILILPAGEEAVSISYSGSDKIKLGNNITINPVQRPYPLSYKGAKEFTAPNKNIYNNNLFTGNEEFNLQTQFYRGHPVAMATISPFEYYPESGELYYYQTIEVTIQTEQSDRAANSERFLRNDSQTLKWLAGYVQNPEDLPVIEDEITRNDDYELLIITRDYYLDYLQDYIEYKNKTGWHTKTITVENIENDYTGVDTQEKIRNCIIDEYDNFDISYLLLAGDDEDVPHRGFWDNAGGWDNDSDIPADIYYGHLDGTWNNDNDNNWGESGEDDLLGELSVGRIACDSQEEFSNFIQKIIRYQQNPVIDDITNSMMVGEDLGWNVWGKDYKEEIHFGSDSNGYSTTGLPSNYNVTTLYDYDQTWNPISDLASELNEGKHLVNHLGHCSTTYAMKLDNPDITTGNFTNDGVENGYYILYSQGCYCGAFDNRTSYGNYVEDSITEVWTSLLTGPVAMVTNSRYGWGDNNTTDGSSQYFDRQFFDAIFGENIYLIGDVQKDAKEDNIPFINHEANRWCYYCSNLFGDPTMDIWTDTPETVNISHNGAFIIGQTQYQVNVNSISGFPMQSARVSLSVNGQCVGSGMTNVNGSVMVHTTEEIAEPGTMLMTVTGHDVIYYEETFNIIPPEGPYLTISGYNVLAGDDDYIEAGEHVTMDIDLHNIGVSNANNVSLQLSCEDQLIILDDFDEAVTNISAGETISCPTAFSFDLSSLTPDNHPITLVIQMDSGENTWSSIINLMAFEPNCFAVNPTNFDIEIGINETLIDTLFLSNTTNRIVNYTMRTEELTRSVEGSHIICSTESFTPGETTDWIFTAYNLSPDNEWVTDINLTFPAGVTVNEASDFIGGSGGALSWDETTGEAVTINWHGASSLGYGNLHQNQAALAEINVTTNEEFAGNITIDYEIIGDGYGEDPHSITGSMILEYPLSWISLASSAGTLSGYETEEIETIFSSEGLDTGYYNCQIIIHDGSRDIKKVPVTMHITNTSSEDDVLSNQTAIIGNFPNPFNPTTTIEFTISSDFNGEPKIEIFNIKGQKVRTLSAMQKSNDITNRYEAIWDGTSDSGNHSGSGIYLYKIKGINSPVNKMIMLK